jgi:hypothetical protein
MNFNRALALTVLGILLVSGPWMIVPVLAQTPASTQPTRPPDTDSATSRAKRWIASSRTAESITGNVEMASDKISFAHKSFKIHLAQELSNANLEDAGKIVNETHTPSSASLYKILIPRSAILLNGNNICGPKDATWMLAVYGRKYLALAFFSGETEPNLDYKLVSVSSSLCGTYGFTPAD